MSIKPSYSSFSSYLTSALVLWRNPDGEEKNWLNRETENYDPVSFYKRVVTTEVLSVALIVFNVIETLIVAISSFGPCYREGNRDKYFSKLQETAFACFWNLEILFFNPFSKNLVTNESFFRYSLYKFPNVSVTKKIIATIGSICFFAASFFSLMSGSWFAFISRLTMAVCLRKLSNTVFLRKNDILYLNRWSQKQGRPNLLLREDRSLPKQVLEILKKKQNNKIVNIPIIWPKDSILIKKMQAIKARAALPRDDSNDSKMMGDTFLVNHILNKISDPKTLYDIVTNEPRVFPYIMTLTIYTFVCGSLKDEDPDILMESTRDSIYDLRKKFSTPKTLFDNITFFVKKVVNPKGHNDCIIYNKQKPLLMRIIEPYDNQFLSISQYEEREKYPEIDTILKALQAPAWQNHNELLLKEFLSKACALWLEKGSNLETVAKQELKEELESAP